ncbi:NAD-dependent epimerase/dehydratase family protein [candidate division KSB1 bacterium]|nr:NAD-dependent epimerase/dehydratase family protein [candidate division KSB1 bacterium]
MSTRALVTGASGFTGGYMVQNLIDHGYNVRVFIQSTSPIEKLKQQGVEFAFGDVRNLEEVENACDDIDVIYHIAALYRTTNVPDSAYWDVNALGTENIMKAAITKGVKRVLHCSTVGVHGHIDNPPATEEAPFNPGDVYQESKLEGEKIALHYYKTKGLPVTVVRPCGIYGPGDFRMLKFYRLIQKRRFVMFGDGNALYHLTYVTDTVEGFRLAAEHPASIGQVYIIAGDTYFTLNQFAETVSKELCVPPPRFHFPVMPIYVLSYLVEKFCVALRTPPPIFRRRVDFFTKSRAFDCIKAKKELHYQPKVGIQEGIRKTIAWYIQKGLLAPVEGYQKPE